MATRTFKGRKIECDYIFPPYLSGVFGKPNSPQTNIICIGESPCHTELIVFDGDCEEEFYEWAKKNGLVTIRKNGGSVLGTDIDGIIAHIRFEELKEEGAFCF